MTCLCLQVQNPCRLGLVDLACSFHEAAKARTESGSMDLGIGLASLKVEGEGLLGTSCAVERLGDAGAGGLGTNPEPAPKAKPKPRPKKDPSQPQAKYCAICDEDTLEWGQGKKKYCSKCTREFESAYNEARSNKELKEFKQIADDIVVLRDFLAKRSKELGPARGSGNKRGGFSVAKFMSSVQQLVGNRAGQKAKMKTKKEFVAIMLARGMKKEPLNHVSWFNLNVSSGEQATCDGVGGCLSVRARHKVLLVGKWRSVGFYCTKNLPFKCWYSSRLQSALVKLSKFGVELLHCPNSFTTQRNGRRPSLKGGLLIPTKRQLWTQTPDCRWWRCSTGTRTPSMRQPDLMQLWQRHAGRRRPKVKI